MLFSKNQTSNSPKISSQQFSQIFHAFFEMLHHPTVSPSSKFRRNQSFFSRKHTPIYRSAKRVTKSSNLDGLHVATGQHKPCNELARCVQLRVSVYMDIYTYTGAYVTMRGAWRVVNEASDTITVTVRDDVRWRPHCNWNWILHRLFGKKKRKLLEIHKERRKIIKEVEL